MDSWMEVRKDPEPGPEQVLAEAKAERERNRRFAESVAKTHREMTQHHFYTDAELCEMGQEDFARDRRNA